MSKNSKKILLLILFTFTILLSFKMTALAAGSDCNFLLGDINDKSTPSPAYILYKAFQIIKLVDIAMVIIFSILDLIKAITSQNADDLNKAIKKSIMRVIIGVVVFVVPSIVDFFIQDLMHFTGTCGIR